jgi:Flp pilus assembly pilin Flp
MHRLNSWDGGSGTHVVGSGANASRRLRNDESGQATVEFALILPVALILIVGIINFGIALNFWLDMQRIANQGARWAVVDAYPGCPRSSAPGAGCATAGAFQTFLSNQKLANGEVIQPVICFESTSGGGGTPTAGDPVRVQITRQFPLRIPFFSFASISLHARATMRTEWDPTVYAPNPVTC